MRRIGLGEGTWQARSRRTVGVDHAGARPRTLGRIVRREDIDDVAAGADDLTHGVLGDTGANDDARAPLGGYGAADSHAEPRQGDETDDRPLHPRRIPHMAVFAESSGFASRRF